MRALFFVLVALNLLAFAAARGWLGASAPEGEPERLTNQLAPERIVLRSDPHPATPPLAPPASPPAPETPAVRDLPATPDAPQGNGRPPAETASAAAEPLACVAFAGLAEKQADALAAQAQRVAPPLRVDRGTTSTPTAWWVRIPPDGGREGAERKVAELRALGVTEYFVVQEPGINQFSVSLGLFKTEAKAEQHLAFLRSKRVRSASVSPRTAEVHRVELHGPAAALASFASSRAAAQPGAVKTGCNP